MRVRGSESACLLLGLRALHVGGECGEARGVLLAGGALALQLRRPERADRVHAGLQARARRLELLLQARALAAHAKSSMPATHYEY